MSLRVFKIRGTELKTFLAQIRAAIEKVLSLLRDKQEEFRDLNKDPSEFSLTELLVHANDEELDALQKFSKIKLKNLEQFELAIRKKASNDVAILVKKVKGIDEDLAVATYSDMLDLTGSRLKIKRDNRNDREFEKHLVQVAFEKMVATMDEKDRKLLEHEISKYAEKHLGKKNLDIALSSGGLIAANLGGFATYTMASTLLSGVGSSIGVTLPFAAYTSLSSTLSVIMGPLGIGALGLWGLYKITSPNTKVTILVVLSLAAIRERLIFEYPSKREEMKKEINNLLQQKETLKELFEKAELLSQPGKVYQLFDNTNKQKLIEEKNG
ncbi:hypothetical protein OAN59_03215 [Alphaproteobacteria bacterium]|nr:hypothetical protein [Alphaproteobacteria bacterium]